MAPVAASRTLFRARSPMGLRPERRWNDGLTKEESIRACVPSHLAYEVERGGNEPSEAFGQCQTGMVPCLQPLSVKHPVAIADPLLHLLHCAILRQTPFDSGRGLSCCQRSVSLILRWDPPDARNLYHEKAGREPSNRKSCVKL
jgi:hypothetical protein